MKPSTAIVLALLLVPFELYFGGYVWARSTHRLVRYSGGFIARPNAISGIGFSTWELVFAPAAWLEEQVRRPLER